MMDGGRMSKPITTEIYRQDDENFRSIMPTLEPSGTIMVDTQDMGPLVQQVFGDSDYEFWIRVPPEAVGRLAFALLKKLYAGRDVDEVRDFCAAEGIPYEGGSWA
jgi:hypothetical protein